MPRNLPKFNKLFLPLLAGTTFLSSFAAPSSISPFFGAQVARASSTAGIVRGTSTLTYQFKMGAVAKDILLKVPRKYRADVVVSYGSSQEIRQLSLEGGVQHKITTKPQSIVDLKIKFIPAEKPALGLAFGSYSLRLDSATQSPTQSSFSNASTGSPASNVQAGSSINKTLVSDPQSRSGRGETLVSEIQTSASRKRPSVFLKDFPDAPYRFRPGVDPGRAVIFGFQDVGSIIAGPGPITLDTSNVPVNLFGYVEIKEFSREQPRGTQYQSCFLPVNYSENLARRYLRPSFFPKLFKPCNFDRPVKAVVKYYLHDRSKKERFCDQRCKRRTRNPSMNYRPAFAVGTDENLKVSRVAILNSEEWITGYKYIFTNFVPVPQIRGGSPF